MKIIKTNGIAYLEHLAENSEWYCGTDYASGDLYEVEEMFLEQGTFKENRLIFVHYPEGRVLEPIKLKANQYFGRPTQIDGIIYILIVDFDKKIIKIMECKNDFEQIITMLELPLSEVKDCYNLQLKGSPLMLTRQGDDRLFEVIWPEKLSFEIGDTEAFLYRNGDKMIFSKWFEDPDYREEVVIRDMNGKEIECILGNIFITPNGEQWILQ